MKEEANNFDLSSIDNESIPAGVRLLPKEGANHLAEVPDDEKSFAVSSSFSIDKEEWEVLAQACRDAGYQAVAVSHGKSIAVW